MLVKMEERERSRSEAGVDHLQMIGINFSPLHEEVLSSPLLLPEPTQTLLIQTTPTNDGQHDHSSRDAGNPYFSRCF